MRTRPALYEKTAYMFEMNNIIFMPNLDMSRGVFGLPGKKMKADTKLTVVMSCQILDSKSVAPSWGDFLR